MCYNVFKPEKPESLSSSGLDASRVTLEYIGALCLLGLLKLLMLVLLGKCRKNTKVHLTSKGEGASKVKCTGLF